jgi:hypothetical protein
MVKRSRLLGRMLTQRIAPRHDPTMFRYSAALCELRRSRSTADRRGNAFDVLARTSPTANTPGLLVPSRARANGQCAAARSSGVRSGPVLIALRVECDTAAEP